MPLIIGAKSATATGYAVDNSCRFNTGDSPELEVTNGTATDNQKWTFSCWIKRGIIEGSFCLMGAKSGTPYFYLYIDDEYKINFYGRDKDNNNPVAYVTNRLFRDVGAFYHIVAAMDSTLAAAGDRFRIYVNGVEETSFATETDPAQDAIYPINYTGFEINVGIDNNGNGPFDGYMAEVCLIDGQQLTPSSFGEFDSDSPTIWKPKDVSELTFGDNGFYLDFEDSADLGADVSGNSNDLTATNLDATDQATDTPTNNFCTINPLDLAITGTAPTLSEGNCLYTSSGAGAGSNNAIRSTIAVSNGKWYWESKWIQNSTVWGMQNADAETRWTDGYLFSTTGTWGILSTGSKTVNGSTSAGVFTALSADDIVGLAFDLDNGKFYMSVNGTFVTSGDPTSGATGTGSLGDLTSGLSYMPVICNASYDTVSIAKMNFGGCPSFTVSSGNADADGYGNFEYAVPSGYYALCTKNLGAYGG